MKKITTIAVYLPYSAKAISALRKIETKYKGTWRVYQEIVTIEVPERYAAKVERLLAPLV